MIALLMSKTPPISLAGLKVSRFYLFDNALAFVLVIDSYFLNFNVFLSGPAFCAVVHIFDGWMNRPWGK
jgi:hypothetical protein